MAFHLQPITALIKQAQLCLLVTFDQNSPRMTLTLKNIIWLIIPGSGGSVLTFTYEASSHRRDLDYKT